MSDISFMLGPSHAVRRTAREATMDVYLDSKESELLMSILERRIEELHREIHHTDSRAFKADLKADEARIRDILAKLRTPAAMGI